MRIGRYAPQQTARGVLEVKAVTVQKSTDKTCVCGTDRKVEALVVSEGGCRAAARQRELSAYVVLIGTAGELLEVNDVNHQHGTDYGDVKMLRFAPQQTERSVLVVKTVAVQQRADETDVRMWRWTSQQTERGGVNAMAVAAQQGAEEGVLYLKQRIAMSIFFLPPIWAFLYQIN